MKPTNDQFLSFYFHSSQERQWEQTSDKSSELKQLYSIPTFQDGKSASSERYAATQRFYVQNRFKRCILLHPSWSRLPEICQISMGGEPLRIFMSMFWARPSTFNFYENTKNTYSDFEENSNTFDHFPGRHVTNGPKARGVIECERNIDFRITALRIHNKSKKVTTPTCSKNRVRRTGYRFTGHDIITSERESNIYSGEVQSIDQKENNLSSRNIPIDRKIVLYSPSGFYRVN